MLLVQQLKFWKFELLLTAEIICYCIFSAFLNPVAWALFIAIGLQYFFRSRKAGLVLAILLVILNVYMLLAWLAAFQNVAFHDANTIMFFTLTGSFLSIGLSAAIGMLIKWSRINYAFIYQPETD